MWKYTPRQMEGYLFLAARRKLKEAALNLSIATSGARGEPREVRSRIKDWSKGEPKGG